MLAHAGPNAIHPPPKVATAKRFAAAMAIRSLWSDRTRQYVHLAAPAVEAMASPTRTIKSTAAIPARTTLGRLHTHAVEFRPLEAADSGVLGRRRRVGHVRSILATRRV